MVGKNYIEFMRRLRYSYFMYVADKEIEDKRIKNLSSMEGCGYVTCLCKVKKKDFKWFNNIMEEYYEKLKEDKEYVKYCNTLLNAVSYKTLMEILDKGGV